MDSRQGRLALFQLGFTLIEFVGPAYLLMPDALFVGHDFASRADHPLLEAALFLLEFSTQLGELSLLVGE